MKRFLSVLVLGALMCLSLPVMAQRNNDTGSGNGHVPGAGVDEVAIKNVNFYPGGNPVQRLASASYQGSNVGGPDWTRPFADGTCCSGLGPVKYHIQYFRVGTTGAYNVRSVQDGWDGYLFIYQGSFDPSAQTVNFVAGDDDGAGGIGTSDIDGINLTAGTLYIAVTTGFENGEEGDFTNTIDGPGTITFGLLTVPTLGEWGMGAFVVTLAVAGAVMMRRRRLAI